MSMTRGHSQECESASQICVNDFKSSDVNVFLRGLSMSRTPTSYMAHEHRSTLDIHRSSNPCTANILSSDCARPSNQEHTTMLLDTHSHSQSLVFTPLTHALLHTHLTRTGIYTLTHSLTHRDPLYIQHR
jgi:hypothetical protein